MPIITIIDTPGAYPGIKAEETGQGAAIAVNLREMSKLRVPIVSIITGEGCSGGALGLAVSNSVMMLEHAYYTVISPEGCASSLWRDGRCARGGCGEIYRDDRAAENNNHLHKLINGIGVQHEALHSKLANVTIAIDFA